MLLEDQLIQVLFDSTCERYQKIRKTIDRTVEARPLKLMRADDYAITTEIYLRMNSLYLRIGEKIQGDNYNLHKDGSLSVIVAHEELGQFIGNGTLNVTVTDKKGNRPYISEFETQISCGQSLNELNPTINEIETNLPTSSAYCVEEYKDEYGPLYRIRTRMETMKVVADASTESAGHILHTHNLREPLNLIDATKA